MIVYECVYVYGCERHIRQQVEHQGGILQTHGVAADRVVDGLARGKGGAAPVEQHRRRAVGPGVHVVGWGRGGHQAITHSWGIQGQQCYSQRWLAQVVVQGLWYRGCATGG